uniref:Uncharacterized protein n=1 Tax=viral metagenome TaxID=1070528 RepID=A0A6H2A1Q9_9ZZZZ
MAFTKILYDKQNFLASLEPGIVTLVVSAFENKLSKKLDGIVESIYKELKNELPTEIKTRIQRVLNQQNTDENIIIEIEIKEPHNT